MPFRRGSSNAVAVVRLRRYGAVRAVDPERLTPAGAPRARNCCPTMIGTSRMGYDSAWSTSTKRTHDRPIGSPGSQASGKVRESRQPLPSPAADDVAP